jgi:anthranilate phosphoribosyltransferase
VLADRGDTALVFHGDDGLDELTTSTTSRVWLVSSGEIRSDVLDPAALGIAAAGPDALRGADAEFNAAVVRQLLAGETGPVRDAVLLNAAATIAAFDGEVASAQGAIEYGLPIAIDAIDSGAAGRLLDSWIASSQTFAAR